MQIPHISLLSILSLFPIVRLRILTKKLRSFVGKGVTPSPARARQHHHHHCHRPRHPSSPRDAAGWPERPWVLGPGSLDHVVRVPEGLGLNAILEFLRVANRSAVARGNSSRGSKQASPPTGPA